MVFRCRHELDTAPASVNVSANTKQEYRGRSGLEAFSSEAMLPVDAGKAILAGRIDLGAGPTPILVRNNTVEDVSAVAATIADLLDEDKPASVSGPILFSLDELVARARAQAADRPFLLSPLDLQVIKAAGVTFAVSAIERVIE